MGSGPIAVITGSLIVQNNSVIEYSRNGVRATTRVGKITFDHSEMSNNKTLFDLSDSWPFLQAPLESGTFPDLCTYADSPELSPNLNSPTSVSMTSSQFVAPALVDGLSGTQIRLSGVNISLNDSEIESLSASKLTAIKSTRGRVSLYNGSKIIDFSTGIDKEQDVFDGCNLRGLSIRSSSIIGHSDFAIRNTSKIISIRDSWIEGNIVSTGLAYGVWSNSNFKDVSSNGGVINIMAPKESQFIYENNFDYVGLRFDFENELTHALCNSWQNNQIFAAYFQDESITPKSWGILTKPSGNKHDGVQPYMVSEAGEIFNYFDPFEQAEIFEYFEEFEGRDANAEAFCNYSLFPGSPPIWDPYFSYPVLDLISAGTAWDSLKVVLDSFELELQNLSGLPYDQKLEEIGLVKVYMGVTLGNVLIDVETDPAKNDSIWASRSNPDFIRLSELYALFYMQEYDSIATKLHGVNVEDAQNFLGAVDWIRNKTDTIQSLKELSQEQLDTLAQFTTKSVGDFTNLLRSFLNVEYDILLEWPEKVIIDPRSAEEIDVITLDKNSVLIGPNPTSDCVTVQTKSGANQEIKVDIFTLDGRYVQSGTIESDGQFCLKQYVQNPGTYVISTKLKGSSIRTSHFIILIK